MSTQLPKRVPGARQNWFSIEYCGMKVYWEVLTFGDNDVVAEGVADSYEEAKIAALPHL